MIDYLRLAFATLVVLAPGRLLARTLAQPSTSATLAWALAAQFATWAIVFTVHGTIGLQLALLAVVGVVALVWSLGRRRLRIVVHAARSGVLAGGIVLGILLWHVEGAVVGDGLFHLARVRKLVDLPHLHLRSVDELAKGGLHPGYAFPLWHGFLADVAKISGLDPSVVVRHEASLLAPLACLVAWEAGVAVFDSVAGGLAVLAASLALFCFAAGHGGSFASLALPATVARQLLVPAGVALFFRYVSSGRIADLAALAALFGSLALVHPTYALFALVPLGAYAVVRLVEWRRNLAALAAALVPVGLAVLWLRPIVDETLSHNPTVKAQAASLTQYAGQLSVSSPGSYHLAPEVFGRTGAVAVAALALVPLAGLAARRRWGAYVLGGTLAILLLELVSPLFVHFSDLVSLSQSRRAAGFAPLVFAFAGGLVLLMQSIFLVPLALVAGIVLQLLWPGDFGYHLQHGGPAAVAWWALGAGALALAAGLWFGRGRRFERPWRGALAAALFVLPVAVHGFLHWTPAVAEDPHALSPQLVRELRQVPAQSVIIAGPVVSYHLAALAPVYLVDSEATHVAATRANDPRARIRQADAWLAHEAPGVPARYGATWAVRNGRLYRLKR